MPVTLREITRGTARAACALDAGDAGIQVAPKAVSLAQAHFWPEAWLRAICADETLVGFVMVHEPTLTPTPEETEFFLWRLMIDRTHQGRGYGRAAIERLVEHVRTRPRGDGTACVAREVGRCAGALLPVVAISQLGRASRR
jgi:diamine N-acetyltransferase